MDDTKAPAPKPDLLAEAGELMRRFAKGEAISGTLYSDRNAAIVLASSILAVAGELRDIHNVLVDVRDLLRGDIGDMTSPAEFDDEVVVA